MMLQTTSEWEVHAHSGAFCVTQTERLRRLASGPARHTAWHQIPARQPPPLIVATPLTDDGQMKRQRSSRLMYSDRPGPSLASARLHLLTLPQSTRLIDVQTWVGSGLCLKCY